MTGKTVAVCQIRFRKFAFACLLWRTFRGPHADPFIRQPHSFGLFRKIKEIVQADRLNMSITKKREICVGDRDLWSGYLPTLNDRSIQGNPLETQYFP